MSTLVTSFLLLLVILGNNQASPVPQGDHGDYLTNLDEEAEPLILKMQNDGNDYQLWAPWGPPPLNPPNPPNPPKFNPQFIGFVPNVH